MEVERYFIWLQMEDFTQKKCLKLIVFIMLKVLLMILIYLLIRKRVTELRFDINKLNKYYEIGDSQKLISLAYSYESNITYVKEEEYVELVKLLKFMSEKVYEMKERDVQEAFFDVIEKTININFGKCEKFKEVIDLVIKKIELNFMHSWELAESLLIISATMDKNYSAIMSKYMEHGDSYVREVVKEYFINISQI